MVTFMDDLLLVVRASMTLPKTLVEVPLTLKVCTVGVTLGVRVSWTWSDAAGANGWLVMQMRLYPVWAAFETGARQVSAASAVNPVSVAFVTGMVILASTGSVPWLVRV